jgi:ATP-dependent Clp protease ATP-binding subunit ClpA
MFEWYSDRARILIATALWSARRRKGSYIEPEDLLHALIREDRGNFTAISTEIFPGATAPIKQPAGAHRPFFADDVATNLLRELHEDAELLDAGKQSGKLEPVPHVDMPVSDSLKYILALVAKARQNDKQIIEPLHLLAALVEDRDSRLAQLLRDHGITRQKVTAALESEHDI